MAEGDALDGRQRGRLERVVGSVVGSGHGTRAYAVRRLAVRPPMLRGMSPRTTAEWREMNEPVIAEFRARGGRVSRR